VKKLKRSNRLTLFITIFGIIFIYLFVSVLIQLSVLPEILRITPEQEFILSARYPLSFHQNTQLNIKNKSEGKVTNILTNRLILNSNGSNHFNVQLRLFGAIPLKKVRVEVSDPLKIIPGGQAIGVLFSSAGVVIVGHAPLKGMDRKQYYPAREAGLKVGDIILKVNNKPINRVTDVEKMIQEYQPGQRNIKLQISRDGKIIYIKIKPVLSPGLQDESDVKYRLGIFIEDPAAGVGTLTFIEPNSFRFAGLGHRISHYAGKRNIPFKQGEIVLADISGVRKGQPGEPGEKIGIFGVNQSPIGKITKNSRFGIYGTLLKSFHTFEKPMPIAYNSQIKLGPAEIYTVIKDRQVRKFQVEIIKIFRQDIPKDKGLVIRVTDPELLKETGGIIQGMSGSPIIQEQKLVGAVTHVFVNDPTKGYGVLAEWMVNELKTINNTYQEDKAS
jgi:stage IV sporulation protein B